MNTVSLDTIDQRNLEALLLTLACWNRPLPTELHSQIKEISSQLDSNQNAVSDILNLLESQDTLIDQYETTRAKLKKKEDSQERSKRPVGGVASPNGLNGFNDFISDDRFLIQLAVPILTSDNFSATAQRLVRQPVWQAQAQQASEDIHAFFQTLKSSVTELDSLSVRLLEILDRDVFTPSSLAYRVDLPEEFIRPTLEKLWHQNYVRPLSTSILGNLFGPLNIFTPKQGSLPSEDHYLGLTAKGYYSLHPHPLYLAITNAKHSKKTSR